MLSKRTRNKMRELSTIEIKRLFEDVTELGARYLCLSGGEPTLRSDIFEIIQSAKEKGLQVELITNGTLVNQNFAEKLVTSGLDILTFSLDSAESYPHDFIRGVKGSWIKTVEGIKYTNYARIKLKRNMPKISIDYVVTRLNVDQIVKVVNLKCELGFDKIHFLPVIQKTARAKNLLLGYHELEKLCSILPQIKNQMKMNELPIDSLITLAYICRFREATVRGEYALPLRSEIICTQPWYMATIDPFGNVYPCCYACTFQNMPDEYAIYSTIEQKFNMGNIKNETFKDIWDGPKFRSFRMKCKTPLAFNFCKICNYNPERDIFFTGIFYKPSFMLKYINEKLRTSYNPLQTKYFYF